MDYLRAIRDSRHTVCSTGGSETHNNRHLLGKRKSQRRDLAADTNGVLPPSQSSVDCFTAPFIPVGESNKATISLCRSRNLVLDSCAFFAQRRKGTLTKKFPMPVRGAVKLACDFINATAAAESDPDLQFLAGIHHDVWWANASRDDAAVRHACAPDSPLLVTAPTLFVMRDRHANYAHEMEVVSMAFSFLAALEPSDVSAEGVQVVIVDQAPPTGFLETWARMSQPHRMRILAHDPFPAGTCFRSAFHVYTFAAGIGYNTNPETIKCESPIVTGLSNWLRQLYREGDPLAPRDISQAAAAAATAGPATAAAGVRGLKLPAGGILTKNVVWLSRRNLEMLRMLLNTTAGWKAMRMVRNEEAVVSALMAAVQEWNAETCLLKRFGSMVESEYERAFSTVNQIRLVGMNDTPNAAGSSSDASAGGGGSSDATAARRRRSLQGGWLSTDAAGGAGAAGYAGAGYSSGSRGRAGGVGGRVLAADGGGSIDEHANDEDSDGDGEEEEDEDAGNGGIAGNAGAAAAKKTKPSYVIGSSVVVLDRLWELHDAAKDDCRRTNVQFKFVDGDFNDMPYHQQLHLIFRTGVLVGVHGAGLTHGFFMPPGQSAVLQLLGESFSKVAANNVFRNMGVSLGNFYEDVLYEGLDVNVAELKKAVKRAMDFVSEKAMAVQQRHNNQLRLVLDDQSHFQITQPSPEQCPSDAKR